MNSQVRLPRVVGEFVYKTFYEDVIKPFHYENMKDDKLSNVGKVMTRILFFDLSFLRELDEQNSSDFDFEEISFTYNLLLDVTRIVGDRIKFYSQIANDTERMKEVFKTIKGNLGIIVPTANYIEAFKKLVPASFVNKLGACCEDLDIGTPDMFRGRSKELVIVAPIRSSK